MPTDKEKIEGLRQAAERERQALVLYLSTRISKSVLSIDEYIQGRLLQGTSLDVIKVDLLDDLANNGRLFSEFRRAIKATVRGSVNRARDNAFFNEEGFTTMYRWSAVLVKTCPDCLARHGKIKTYEEWEAEGLPRSGQTVCRDNCHCILVPAKFTEYEPIQRTKR